MRPNQQNKNRSRGRNGGRKNVNPLSRNFESNGPDVKIRGNASHIAERYVQLARDATATGDSVMAENYLQHAEHYFRILSAAQAQMQPQQQPRNEPSYDYDEDDNETDTANSANEGETRTRADAGPVENADRGERSDADTETAEAAGNGEDKSDRPRTRRPRRRRQNEGGENGDLSDAPQPEVGELPAFLTGGNASAAE